MYTVNKLKELYRSIATCIRRMGGAGIMSLTDGPSRLVLCS
jgi:hypothetical protein